MEMSFALRLTIWISLGLFGAVLGFGCVQEDYVAAVSLAAVTVTGLWGYYLGAMRIVGCFSSITTAYAFASPVGQWISKHIVSGFDTAPGTTRLLSVTGGCLVLFLLASTGMTFLSRRLLRDRPQLETANRLLGFGFGGIQGMVAAFVVLSGILAVEPYANERVRQAKTERADDISSMVSKKVVGLAQETRMSSVGSFVATYSPFENSPQFKNLGQTASVISSPDRLHKAIHSPAVRRLKNHPELRGVFEALARDPKLRRLAESGRPLDQETAMALLNHPEVAKILEQPQLMKHFAEAMGGTEEQ